MSFDRILQGKMGFGKAQLTNLFFLCFVDFDDGVQLVLSSLLTPVVQNEWSLNSHQVSLLASIFYLGIFIGCLISGKLADKHGRKRMIIVGSASQFFFSLFFLFTNHFMTILINRFFYGLAFGITIVLTTSMYAQSAPIKYRGKGLLFLNFCVSLGKFYGVILACIFLQNFTTGNWKGMMFASCLANIFVLFGSIFVMYQSPRFLIANQRYDEAFQIINRIIQKNHEEVNEPQLLTLQEKQQIKQWRNQVFANQQPAQISSLFNEEFLRTTICIGTCWFTINFIFYGQSTVLPFIFGKQKLTFLSFALTVLAEAPTFLIATFLIDRPEFGRRKSLIYLFICSAISNIMFSFIHSMLVPAISRFFMQMCFSMLYPCTTQSYNTFNRAMGFGFNQAIGKLAATIMPYIVLPLLEYNLIVVFILFGVIGGIGVISSCSLPRDGSNKPLDQLNDILISPQSTMSDKQMKNFAQFKKAQQKQKQEFRNYQKLQI